MYSEEAKGNRTEHRMLLNERKRMEIFGVTDVVSFDEESVILDTVCGRMTVEGSALHIRVLNLSDGVVTLEGTVDAVVYAAEPETDGTKRSGFLSKLFH